MSSVLLLLVIGASASGPAPQAETKWGSLWASAQVSTGAEWDTNAKRAVAGDLQNVFLGASRPTESVPDGLMRMLLDAQTNLQIGKNHQIYGGYVLGAKRFFQQATEDLLTHNLTLGSQHRLSDRLDLGVSGWFKASRIRAQLRDYNLGLASTQLGIRLVKGLRLDLGADVRSFRFYNESRFDYWGAQAFLHVSYAPTAGLSLFARGTVAHRRYRGNALVEGLSTVDPDAPPLLLFCEDPAFEARQGIQCTPAGQRRDDEGQVNLGLRFRKGSVLVRGGYLLRLQRSNGDFENINRHRVYGNLTWALPWWRLTSNVMATLQINDGVSVTDTKFLAEDDENQNSLRIQLRRPVSDIVDVELNYGLFANQFSTADVSFLRQTISLGVRAHLEGTQAL